VISGCPFLVSEFVMFRCNLEGMIEILICLYLVPMLCTKLLFVPMEIGFM
jgi:hypothetical protein